MHTFYAISKIALLLHEHALFKKLSVLTVIAVRSIPIVVTTLLTNSRGFFTVFETKTISTVQLAAVSILIFFTF